MNDSQPAQTSADRPPTTSTGAAAAPPVGKPESGSGGLSGGRLIALLFMAPALITLAVLVLYPIFYTVIRSLFDANGSAFVGIENYKRMFTSEDTFQALKNNAIWVVVVPTVVTSLGLIFAVLTERVRWSTAFKIIVFMPMAISFLAAGVTFRFVYDNDPKIGLANAVLVGVHDTFKSPSEYPKARPRDNDTAVVKAPGGGFQAASQVSPGQAVSLPLVGMTTDELPKGAADAAAPAPGEGVTGVVWLDFRKGGGGKPNVVDSGEKGMPGMVVEAVQGNKVVATTTADDEGRFAFPNLASGSYTIRLAESNFAQPYRGVSWIGPSLVTPSIMGAYLWMWAGFAMVLIAAGLAAIPRDALEAARVDGATEWQVFRRVTIPLVRPVLIVVVVTLIINVLKVFDLVYIISRSGGSGREANVVAYEMWKVSFGARDYGLGSALGVLLFLLVIPAMLSNIRRFRKEQQ